MFTCPDGLAFYLNKRLYVKMDKIRFFNKTVQFDVCIFLP